MTDCLSLSVEGSPECPHAVTHYVSLTELSAPFSAPCIPHTTKRQRLCMSLKPAPGVDPRVKEPSRVPQGPGTDRAQGGLTPGREEHELVQSSDVVAAGDQLSPD